VGGASAAVSIFLLGALLILLGWLWPKKSKPQESPPFPPQNTQTLKQEANPRQEQHVHIGSDFLQPKPAPPARTPQPEPPSNIHFIEIKTVDGTFSRAIAHRLHY
jgi:hypothetical protein